LGSNVRFMPGQKRPACALRATHWATVKSVIFGPHLIQLAIVGIEKSAEYVDDEFRVALGLTESGIRRLAAGK